MNYVVKTHYNRSIINEAAIAYWRQTFAQPFFISLILMLIALGIIFLLDIRDWISGTFLSLSIISLIIFCAAFFIYRNRSLAIFEEMESADAEWTFSEEGFFVRSDAGSAEVKWKIIKKIIKTPNSWLFVYKNNSYSVFPLDSVSDEILKTISERVEEQRE